ncbi:sulfite exporter TauE/SafE family protein [Falsirhodobacter xinxiangensis]|uniref:sulfite exporter TauE/SafE family protein n=1 Tax=Falsirhodobacter xinxiangensis TaxID=2530049 RepID=UPI0010A9C8A4|nr:sulfite exporter TauE/SafE family protein [Rhodobacter xinxiangensis]
MVEILGLPMASFLVAFGVTLVAGFVKGAIGFAMPLVMMSAFSAFLPPQYALAGLILPVAVTNIHQMMRDGWGAALASAWKFRRFVIGTILFIGVSAQFADKIPQSVFLVMLGLPITIFAALQLAGRKLALRLEHRNRAEWVLGVIGGLYGGVSGIWGPPLLVYLLSIGTEKTENVRVQGVIFFIGSTALLAAHLQTGLLRGDTLNFSAALVVPAFIGMFMGYRLQDSLDQDRFRWWTQVLLIITGLNLLRQAVM